MDRSRVFLCASNKVNLSKKWICGKSRCLHYMDVSQSWCAGNHTAVGLDQQTGGADKTEQSCLPRHLLLALFFKLCAFFKEGDLNQEKTGGLDQKQAALTKQNRAVCFDASLLALFLKLFSTLRFSSNSNSKQEDLNKENTGVNMRTWPANMRRWQNRTELFAPC